MYADGTDLVAEKESKLQSLVMEFGKARNRRKVPVNVVKSKVMRVTRRKNADTLNITVNGVGIEEI
jgi:hypothetical protein